MRHWAITAEYLYFHYLFSGSLPLLPGIASASDRQSVRIGLTGSLPLLRD
jgi:hypothetical protein